MGTSNDTVILTTSAQTADEEYELTYKGDDTGKTFIGKAAEGQAFEIDTAEARSNTEVTVVLTDAPLRPLTTSDFSINGLEVISVTLNDNVVSLKTSPQVAGTSYTVTSPTSGVSSATFTGLGEVDAAGVIENINLDNLRQIKIEFNRPMDWATAEDLSNYYIAMTDHLGDAGTEISLADIDNNGNWRAIEGKQNILDEDGNLDPEALVSYVIIESTDGDLVTDAVGQGLGLTYNEGVTIETRGLRDANGFVSNSKGAFTVVDAAAPLVQSVTGEAAVNGLTASDNYTIVNDRAYVEVKFNEPVKNWDDEKFRVYVNGIAIDSDSTVTDEAFIVNSDNYVPAPPPATGDNVIDQTSTVDANRTMLIDVTGLERSVKNGAKVEHDLKIVGAEDLQGNVQAENPYQTSFSVYDEVVGAPADIVKPAVRSITQVGDNALQIVFDQPNVRAVTNATELVTIKGADYLAPNEKALDLTAAMGDIAVTTTATSTTWTVEFDADINNGGETAGSNATAGSSLDYLSQEEIIRTVEVKNYTVSQVHAFYYGDTERHETTFKLDQEGPQAQTVTTGITTGLNKNAYANGLINVTFTDGPFTGLGTIQEGAGTITISRTDNNGNTTAEDFDASTIAAAAPVQGATTAAGLNAGNKELVISLSTGSDLTKADGTLFAESVYTVTFNEGTIFDADETITGVQPDDMTTGSTADLTNIKITHNPITKQAKSVTTPKIGESGGDEGLVPQTSKFLIQSGTEIANSIPNTGGAVTEAGLASQIGSGDWFALPENQNKIIVAFDGDVLETSAQNKGNYKFNNRALPQGSKVTYFTDNVNNQIGKDGLGASKEHFVIIELPAGSVQKDGQYTIEVFNITSKAGKAMLPVKDAVTLIDNTPPVISNVKVIGSKQIELTLDENVTIPDAAKAVKNFNVTINGSTGNDVAVVKHGTTNNKIVLEMASNFDTTAKVSVKVVANDGKFYVKDEAGNDIAQVVKSN